MRAAFGARKGDCRVVPTARAFQRAAALRMSATPRLAAGSAGAVRHRTGALGPATFGLGAVSQPAVAFSIFAAPFARAHDATCRPQFAERMHQITAHRFLTVAAPKLRRAHGG